MSKTEILTTIKRIEVCKLCKSCSKVVFSSNAAQLLEEIVNDYELYGTSPTSTGYKTTSGAHGDSSRPIRSANRYPNMKAFKEQMNINDHQKDSPSFRKMGESHNERSEGGQKDSLFNISHKSPYMKTPHILRSRGKKMSLNPTECIPNNSDLSGKDKVSDEHSRRGSSYQRPNTQHIPSAESKQRFLSEKPAEERASASDLLSKQIILKVNSARDQRLKELDRNSSIFEKRTKELVHRIIDCKYWIPVSFLIRLTYEQIEKNFPIEEPVEKTIAPNDFSAFLDELKVALECGKNLFSKSP